MMMKITVALMACGLFAATVTAEGDSESKVLVLDDTNFGKVVAEHTVLLVEFYAPWCGHCKALEPEYDAAALTLAEDNIFIAKLDADVAKASAGKFHVSSFPTIKLFRDGEFAEDYSEGRKAGPIVEYMKKKAAQGSAVQEITSLDELKQKTKAKFVTKTTVVGFFSNIEGVDFKIFKAVVASLGAAGIDIYYTSNAAVLEGFGFYSSGSSIQIFRPTAKPFKQVYRGTVFKASLKEWLIKSALPAVAAYTEESQNLFAMVEKNIVRVAAAKASDIDTKALAALAEANPELLFGTSDSADFASDVENFCGKDVAVCVLAQEHKSKGGKVFGMPGDYTVENVKQFVADFSAKKLKQKVKSEAAAPAPKAGEVAVVTGNTFDAIVMDDSKDVMIEFYAPWCGHCKQLTPKYEELAKIVEAEFETLVIAKMDQTANDIPAESAGPFKVEGFPTIYFAPKGKKNAPITYDGARTAEGMNEWITEKRTA